MRKYLLVGLTCLLGLAAVSGASAETSKRYEGWRPTGEGDSGIKDESFKKFVDELQALLTTAKRDKAADPRFIQDLEKLIAKYQNPWGEMVFRDQFEDGDFTNDPAWKVIQGRFWVERGLGLRSRVKSARFSREMTEEEQAKALISAILGTTTGTKTQAADPGDDEPAAIALPAKVPNSFVTEVQFRSHEPGGHLEFGVYQVGSSSAGYRVIYRPGLRLRLVKVSGRGVSVVGRSSARIKLEDNRSHTIRIARFGDGKMVVAVDDKQVLTVTDTGFRDPFDGFALVNRAGDFSVSRVVAVGSH